MGRLGGGGTRLSVAAVGREDRRRQLWLVELQLLADLVLELFVGSHDGTD